MAFNKVTVIEQEVSRTRSSVACHGSEGASPPRRDCACCSRLKEDLLPLKSGIQQASSPA
eukprot:750309-Hanusia_phi.AAC.2